MIHSVKNQYFGINAHFHSQLQSAGEWSDFHLRHIAALAESLAAALRPKGYVTRVEDSLQIRRVEERPRYLESDISIYDIDPSRFQTAVASGSRSLSGLVLPMAVAMETGALSEKPYRTVAIYRRDDQQKPIVWLELLSPSNKRPGEDRDTYLMKRQALLEGGLVFVELDYLHETPPTLSRLPIYPHAPGSHPYRILVFDPYPAVQDGRVSFNEFRVDEPIPTVTIPLSGSDSLDFNFDVPYQTTFERSFYGDSLDYAQLPLNFDRYSPADQARIAARLVAVLDAAQRGLDLESGPFPAEPIPLDAALARLNTGR